MPGRLFLTRPLAEVALGEHCAEQAGNDVPRSNIAPGQELAVLTEEGFRRMRWGIIPVGRVNARGRPVMETIINARSETVFDKSAFDGVRRAAVPVDGWYEWTGKTRRKTAWRICAKDTSLLWFAAIWDVWQAPNGAELAQVATVTCTPNADVKPIHHRMGVILKQKDVPLWISGNDAAARALMKPWPDDQLSISEAKGMDWSAP